MDDSALIGNMRRTAGRLTEKNGLNTGNLYAQTVSLAVQRAMMHFATPVYPPYQGAGEYAAKSHDSEQIILSACLKAAPRCGEFICRFDGQKFSIHHLFNFIF